MAQDAVPEIGGELFAGIKPVVDGEIIFRVAAEFASGADCVMKRVSHLRGWSARLVEVDPLGSGSGIRGVIGIDNVGFTVVDANFGLVGVPYEFDGPFGANAVFPVAEMLVKDLFR